MIKPIWSYGRRQVWPRLRRIIIQPQVALCLAVSIACFHFATRLPCSQLRPSDLGVLMLAYAAIALGFCITGMALVLTLPNEKFLNLLQGHKVDGQSSYLDLLFVFSWTAVSHWLLVVGAIIVFCFRGESEHLLVPADPLLWKAFVSWLFGVCAYSLIQFLLTVITLSQVGQLYSDELAKGARPK